MKRRKIDVSTIKLIRDKFHKSLPIKTISTDLKFPYFLVEKITLKISKGLTDA